MREALLCARKLLPSRDEGQPKLRRPTHTLPPGLPRGALAARRYAAESVAKPASVRLAASTSSDENAKNALRRFRRASSA